MVERRTEQPARPRTLLLMAALTALASALGAAGAALFEGVAWYEAALPCLGAGAVFVALARWSVRRIESDPASAMGVMMAGIGMHFAVIVGGGLALILAADFQPVATYLSLLAAFAIGQPLGTLAVRRAILASPRPKGDGRTASAATGGGAAATNSTRTLIAEASA